MACQNWISVAARAPEAPRRATARTAAPSMREGFIGSIAAAGVTAALGVFGESIIAPIEEVRQSPRPRRRRHDDAYVIGGRRWLSQRARSHAPANGSPR